MVYKILAVDDHPETLDIVVATLRGHGYHVVGSRSPLKALSLVEQMQPDLMLIDMNMPEMDGKELCRQMRAKPHLAEVPIIMFSAEDEPSQKLAGFEAGVDDYLTKPTDPIEMVARIEAMLASVGKPPQESEPIASSPLLQQQEDPLLDLLDKAVPIPSATTALPLKETLITVMGARGGAGATTVAINLATSIAKTNYPTTLIDLDMQQGHVALYLNQNAPGGGINALASYEGAALGQQARQQVIFYGDNLQMLLTRPNLSGEYPILTIGQVTSLLDSLMQPGRCTVVDLGQSTPEASRLILDQSDHVIVCLQPERVALSSAKLYLHHLRGSLFPHTTLSALVFNVGGGVNLPKEAIENFLGHPLMGIISVDPNEMAKSVNKATPLVQLFPQSKSSILFSEITQKLTLVKS